MCKSQICIVARKESPNHGHNLVVFGQDVLVRGTVLGAVNFKLPFYEVWLKPTMAKSKPEL